MKSSDNVNLKSRQRTWGAVGTQLRGGQPAPTGSGARRATDRGQLEARWPSFTGLDPVRQRVLIHIAFDLSVAGLLMLRRLIMAVECGFWDTAAEKMLASPWAKHDRRQAAILAEMMRVGRDLTAA